MLTYMHTHMHTHAHTQYELALGKFPYPAWKNVFDQLKTVVEGEAPKVPADLDFSQEFKDFVHLW